MNLISGKELFRTTGQRPRTFLFLQGVASHFFSQLAGALAARGHGIKRINFNGGDRLFWNLPHAENFVGDLAAWGDYLEERLALWFVTDIILFGDCRPLHAQAVKIAKDYGINSYIFEEGYIRPNWLTIEQGGTNGYSTLPKTIEGYLSLQSEISAPPDPPEELPTDMVKRSIEDVAYTFACLMMFWRYKGYRRYRHYPALVEYASGARRLAYRHLTAKKRARAIQTLVEGSTPYFVWPMQIEVDSQIKVHSQFNSVEDVIDTVLLSFAKFAPPDALLVLTEHPLETSPRNWRRYFLRRARVFGLHHRVQYLVNGSPDKILSNSQGVVVINSTIGQRALDLGVPLIALSPAVFNMPGLTFQDGIDRFWTEAVPANAELVRIYRQGVIAKCQINGGLYSKRGIEVGVRNAVARIEDRVAALGRS